MDQIQHKYIDVRGLKLHIAEIGTGSSVVVFLHGFPEIWYSWRHQMIAVANAGFRAIAPDFRGYGLSQQPSEPEKTTFNDLVEDLLAILDSLAISKIFLIAKDFGTQPAYLFGYLHPERVSGAITLGVPFMPPPSSAILHHFPKGSYILRWQEPEHAEDDFQRFDAKTVLKNIYILFSRNELPIAENDKEIMNLVEPSTPLPPWFSEEDLKVYASLYEQSGFKTAMQVPYRSLNDYYSNIKNPKVQIPALLIMGGKDFVLKLSGTDDHETRVNPKDYVCELETVFLPEGSHFVQEQFPDEVNHLILKFLNSHNT